MVDDKGPVLIDVPIDVQNQVDIYLRAEEEIEFE